MDDLVAHIDGRAELLEGPFDDVDGADDAGAEPARLSKHHPHTVTAP
jgi:hypothetical protein